MESPLGIITMPRHNGREAQPFNGLHVFAGLFSDLAVKFVLCHSVVTFRIWLWMKLENVVVDPVDLGSESLTAFVERAEPRAFDR
jgi:hypothetical protein